LAIISKGNLIYSDTMANFRAEFAHQSLTEAFIDIVKHDGKQMEVVT
jgi:ABC-type Na+ transport system ATPase subunit NatA